MILEVNDTKQVYMRILCLLLLTAVVGASLNANAQPKPKKPFNKKVQYEEINFEDMIRRYYEKEIGPFNAAEGIYSVSCLITRRGKNIFGTERERVVERKDNYARVAILKDRPQAKRDYIEVSLSYREADKYPVMGELNILSEGRGLIYKHIEPDGSVVTFSMKDETDLIEGEYAVIKGRKTITYKLSYLKIYPKAAEQVTSTGFSN
jgi:hypothetical protein